MGSGLLGFRVGVYAREWCSREEQDLQSDPEYGPRVAGHPSGR
jgi:hypothetical protein